MLQPSEIKVEQEERKKQKKRRNSLPECTCPSISVSEELNHSGHSKKKDRQVLVNFGLKRKKIFTLKSKKDNLHQMFLSYISGDPAFSKLLVNAYVVLQQFNSKFGTYVDVDNSKTLSDGSVVKAVFFPTRLERNDENPGSIKSGEPKHIQNSSTDLIQIDSSDSSSDEVDTTVISSSCEVSTITVDVAPDQTSAKKKKKKRHSQDAPNSLESSVEKQQNLDDDNDIEIKLEDISVNELVTTKSPAASSKGQSGQITFPVLSPVPETERSPAITSHPGITAGNIPLNGSPLDTAVSQNQKQKDRVRSSSGKRDTEKVKKIEYDAVTKLHEVCIEELFKEPFYSWYNVGKKVRCKVLVNGSLFCGQGSIVQSAKQDAASTALASMFISTGCRERKRNPEERFGKMRKSDKNESRYNIVQGVKESGRKMIEGEKHREKESGGGEREGEKSRHEKNGVRETEEISRREGSERGVRGERKSGLEGSGRGRGSGGCRRGRGFNSRWSGREIQGSMQSVSWSRSRYLWRSDRNDRSDRSYKC